MMLKKFFSDDLLQITILISLLRVDWLSYISINRVRYPELQEIILGTSSAYTQTQFHNFNNRFDGYGYVHPKSVDLEWTQRSIFDEIRTLSRYNHRGYGRANRQIAAFLVSNYENSPTPNADNAHTSNNAQIPNVPISQDTNQISLENNLSEEGAVGSVPICSGSELSKEDMDLIDILWKQDIDMGVGREMFDTSQRQTLEKEYEHHYLKNKEMPEENPIKEEKLDDWSGIDYYVDSETGEFIAYEKPSVACSFSDTFDPLPSKSELDVELPPELSDISFNESMVLESNEPEISPPTSTLNTPNVTEPLLNNPLISVLQSSGQEQRGPSISRSISLEQRWQDLVSILDLNVTNTQESSNSFTPMDDSRSNDSLFSPNLNRSSTQHPSTFISSLENASLSTTAILSQLFNSSDPTPYHSTQNFGFDDCFSFSNSTQMNTTDISGFLPMDTINLDDVPFSQDLASPNNSDCMYESSPILNDLSDSVSRSSECSHGSSFDGLEGATAMKVDSHVHKLSSGCESGYSGSDIDSFSMDNEDDDFVFDPDPDLSSNSKYKHYKHFYNEKSLLEYIHHNHTYNVSTNSNADSKKITMRDKNAEKQSQQYSRDERRAKEMKIPISNDKIINLPIDEFNELLSKYKLSEAQLSLVRDIRRRGKNKMAAQNCRKRKVDSISILEDHIIELRKRHNNLKKEHQTLLQLTNDYREKFQELYQEVFHRLRDESGRPLSPNDYTLQQTSNGSFFILPRHNTSQNTESNSKSKKKSSTEKK